MPTPTERVIPVLVDEDLPAAHDCLVSAFGFAPGGVEHDGEGNPVHAEIYLGEQAIWLHRAVPDMELGPPVRAEVVQGGVVVHVADVDEHCARAKAAGAMVTREPDDQPDGQREYEARDAEGHRWWFATPTS